MSGTLAALGRAAAGLLTTLGLASGVAACFGPQSFACQDAAQCIVDGIQGFCEPVGFCSFSDGSCESGRRFSPFAGGAAAGVCVETDGAGTSSGATTDAMDGPSGGMSTGAAETQDDGATTSSMGSESGTGCGEACADPGTELWSQADTELGVGRANAIAAGEGMLAVTGTLEERGDTELLLGRYDIANGERISAGAVANEGSDVGWGIAVLPGGDLAVVGQEASPAGPSRGFLARFDAASTVVWKVPRDDALLGTDASETAIVVVGNAGDNAIVGGYDLDGATQFSRVITPAGAATTARLQAVAMTPGGAAWAAGFSTETASSARLLRFTASASTVVDESHPQFQLALAVAPTPTGAIVGGEHDGAGWLGWADAQGTLMTTETLSDASRVWGLASAADGRAAVVGTRSDGTSAWIAAYDPDGEQRWTATVDDAMTQDALSVAVSDETVYIAGYRNDGADAVWLASYAL
ncbi:MAG: hypothetical protein AAF721_28075 [Myxococcota bacterium]